MADAYQAMEDLQERISALERAVTDDDHDLSALSEAGEHAARLTALEEQVADIADSVAELDAATQAIRGYMGNIKAVNRDVEQRADAALASAEAVADRESSQADSIPTSEAPDTDTQIPERHTNSDMRGPASDRPLTDAHGERSGTHCPACGHKSEMPSPSIADRSTNDDTERTVTPRAPQSDSTHTPTATSSEQKATEDHCSDGASHSPGNERPSSESGTRTTGSRTIGRANGDARHVLDSVMDVPAEHNETQSSTGPLGQLRNML